MSLRVCAIWSVLLCLVPWLDSKAAVYIKPSLLGKKKLSCFRKPYWPYFFGAYSKKKMGHLRICLLFLGYFEWFSCFSYRKKKTIKQKQFACLPYWDVSKNDIYFFLALGLWQLSWMVWALTDGKTVDRFHLCRTCIKKDNFSLPTDPTDPPGDPKIEDYDKDYVEVGWLPPERENGAPVDKYIIDVREKGRDDWKKVVFVYKTA